MDDLNKNKAVVDLPDVEASPTTRLLKKKTDGIQGETAGTTPLTHRLADISTIGEAEEKKKSGAKWLIIGIVAVVLIGAGVGGYFFLSSDESGIFSGGGSGIDGSGTDSMDANIVQGGGAAPSLPADRTAAAPGETRTAATAAPTAAPSAGPAQPAPAPEPSASTVEAARVDKPTSAISSGSDAAPSIGAPAAPAPATTTPAAPAAAAPAPSAPESGNSLESGFTLSEQAQVKEGDLVPLTADVIKPETVSRSQPRMPPLAQQMRKSGQVIVRVLVDENGSVSDARLVSENPKGFGFGQAALDAAGKFKYKPARKGNVRVRVWDTIFFTFR
jgi:TonB family protein